MPVPPALKLASKSFYAAINQMLKGNVAPMAEVWAQTALATAMHPIGGAERGWPKVKKSWAQVAAIAGGGKVTLKSAKWNVGKDMDRVGRRGRHGRDGGDDGEHQRPCHERLRAHGPRVEAGASPHGSVAGHARGAADAAAGRRVEDGAG